MRIAALTVIAITTIGCSADEETPAIARATITPAAGGTVTIEVDGGGVTVTVPPGAVTEDVEISARILDEDELPVTPVPLLLQVGLELLPDMELGEPAEITVLFEEADIREVVGPPDFPLLWMASVNADGTLEGLNNSRTSVDVETGAVEFRGETTHFSTWVVPHVLLHNAHIQMDGIDTDLFVTYHDNTLSAEVEVEVSLFEANGATLTNPPTLPMSLGNLSEGRSTGTLLEHACPDQGKHPFEVVLNFGMTVTAGDEQTAMNMGLVSNATLSLTVQIDCVGT